MDEEMRRFILRNPLARDFLRVCEEEEFTIKRSGFKWRIYKGDKDWWPSCPHAHDTETGTKLDLSDGTLYGPPSFDVAGKLKADELKALRELFNRKGVSMPVLAEQLRRKNSERSDT